MSYIFTVKFFSTFQAYKFLILNIFWKLITYPLSDLIHLIYGNASSWTIIFMGSEGEFVAMSTLKPADALHRL